ncbi:EcoKI restriction-modification system protein HsdS [Providencia rustigianii]|uniref:EcoKI restriction-modification system protein HsdS n=1 Tax=Providencia rustigianii TaxID=158850 RepID=A0A379G7X1_9GAMM|nr:restriction endonuclease subunit S [Providencia rustigianii]SUC36996.1 EcoKI restriction-modification system protein HsdS [Providencia rustigianii]VEB75659.1 EcoKI restriction-modification system protein HsdS [Providencia rustigianii]
MSADKKEPEIRFKGFSGEWEQKPFRGCFDNIPNNTLSRAELNYEHGIARNVHYGDVLIRFGEILDASDASLPFITDENLVYKQKHAALRNGDIVIADAAEDSTVGKCTELFNIDKQVILSGLHTIAVRPTLPFASKYLGYYLNSSSYHDQLLPLMQGTKVLSISKTALQNTNINFPSKNEEQIKIGNTFQKIDSLINQHQQKHDKLSNLKKAMLEKMFPKHGETIPEIRFKGFSGEWEETVLSEIADKYDNFRIAVTAKDRIAGNTPYYGANGIQDYVDGYTHDGEYILLAEDGANDLKNYPIHYVNGKVWINNHAHVLKAKENGSNIFLKYALNNIEYEPFLVGGGRAKLNASIMMNLVLTISTDIKEQAAIGNFLQKLDTLINQHQQQITKLNNIKQACLSKMFV